MENKTKKIIERLSLGTTAVTLLTKCLELWTSLNKTSKEILTLCAFVGLETIEELERSQAKGRSPRDQRRDIKNIGRRWLTEPKNRNNGRALYDGNKKQAEKMAERLKESWKDTTKETNALDNGGALFDYFEDRGKCLEDATPEQIANALAKIWMNSQGIERVKELEGINIGRKRKADKIHLAIWKGGDLIEAIKQEEPAKWLKIVEVCGDFEEFAAEKKQEEARAARFFENLPDQNDLLSRTLFWWKRIRRIQKRN